MTTFCFVMHWSNKTWIRTLTFLVDNVLLCQFLLLQVRAQELSERSVLLEQLLVRTHLRDASVHHHDDLVQLGKEADAVRHQHTSL